jgi:hypothetical protein
MTRELMAKCFIVSLDNACGIKKPATPVKHTGFGGMRLRETINWSRQ